MKDQRLKVFRDAIEALIESLEAFIRLARWDASEPKPDPLSGHAAKLIDRLGAADRLAGSRFQGPAQEVAKVDAMRSALGRLDAAYAAYCRANRSGAAAGSLETLESEVGA